MVKNTLSSLPIYFMSLFVIPRRVAARLKKIQRDFFVGKMCLRIEATLGKMSYCSVGQTTRRLGIKDLTILNEALLGKWSLRFASERDPL